jgi:hypothetical protein
MDTFLMQTGEDAANLVVDMILKHELINSTKEIVVCKTDEDVKLIQETIRNNFEGIVITFISMNTYLSELPNLMVKI